ncbi:MAG: hypothetical protein AAGK21_09490 [Bacteroidota bacterium]
MAPLTSTATAVVEEAEGGGIIVGDMERGAFAMAGLQRDDRILDVDGDTLAVRRAIRTGLLFASREVGDTISVRVERSGRTIELSAVAGSRSVADARQFGLSARVVSYVNRGLLLLGTTAFIVVGVLLFIRGRASGYDAQLGLALVAVAGMFGSRYIQRLDLVAAIGPLGIALVVLAVLIAISALPVVSGAIVQFPDGRFGPRWTRRIRTVVVVGLVAVLVLVVASEGFGLPTWVRDRIGTAVLIGVVAVPVVGLVQKYRRSSDTGVRQQMKWVVLPLSVFIVALSVPFLGEVVPVLDSDRRATGYLFDLTTLAVLNLALATVPLGILAGVLNFRPWDADLWIARSLAVGAATLGLAAVFAGGAEALRVALRASMGDGAEAVAAALAAVVALVVFNPVREWVSRRADADLYRTRERLTKRLPLLLAGRQVVASPAEIGRVAIATVREALETDRAAVIDIDPEGWEVVAVQGSDPDETLAWASEMLDPEQLPVCSEQVWEDPLFVLRVPLRSADDEPVGVLALGTHGRGRGYSTEERKALDAASRSLAEALRIAELREAHEEVLSSQIAQVLDRLPNAPAGDGQS